MRNLKKKNFLIAELCDADNYTADTIALIDYIPDEEVAGCSLVNMVTSYNFCII